jgi:hypothetical protein
MKALAQTRMRSSAKITGRIAAACYDYTSLDLVFFGRVLYTKNKNNYKA